MKNKAKLLKRVKLVLVIVIIAILTLATILAAIQYKPVQPVRAQANQAVQIAAIIPLNDGTAYIVTWDESIRNVVVKVSDGHQTWGIDQQMALSEIPSQIMITACGRKLWVGTSTSYGTDIRSFDLPSPACSCITTPVTYIPLVASP